MEFTDAQLAQAEVLGIIPAGTPPEEGASLLSQAIALVGHQQTRNWGTVGGSLCHLDPSAEIPTVALAFDATNGLQVKADSANGLSVDATDGLRVKFDSAAALAMDATDGLQVKHDNNYGLSVDATDGLRVNAASTGGLNFSGAGALQVHIASADELSSDASGLAVEGVPSLFKIGGSAVSANVTAANLGTLTDSTSITALHLHANLTSAGVAAAGIAAGNPVYVNSSGGVANAAASSPATATVVGVAVNNASITQPVFYQTHGPCAAFSGLTVGSAYFLDDSGGVDLYAGITSGNRIIRLGYAVTTSIIQLQIQDMGVKP
jgi:hypothetical protein